MATILLTTLIHAPPERCFDLARSVDLHVISTRQTGERAVGSVTSGLLGPGQEVTWSARHFGVRQTLTSRITALSTARATSATRWSTARSGASITITSSRRAARTRRCGTCSTSSLRLGPLGRLVDTLVLERYLRRLLERRNEEIKRVAESEEWRGRWAGFEQGGGEAGREEKQ